MYAGKQDNRAFHNTPVQSERSIRANQRAEFPHRVPDDSAVSRPGNVRSRRPITPPTWRTPCTVLFVETRPGQLAPLIASAPLDARTKVVYSQEAALAQFTRQPSDVHLFVDTPDVLVMNHDLPESAQVGNARPFLAQLQELRITQQALVVIVTPTITTTQKIRAFQLGAGHVLVEPIAPDSFWLTLRLLLRFRELMPPTSWRTVTTEGHGN